MRNALRFFLDSLDMPPAESLYCLRSRQIHWSKSTMTGAHWCCITTEEISRGLHPRRHPDVQRAAGRSLRHRHALYHAHSHEHAMSVRTWHVHLVGLRPACD